MMGYLLDTNTATYIIKGRHPLVRQRLLAVPMHEVNISAVTEGELRYGAARLPAASRLHEIVEEFLVRVAVHSWDSAAAQEYGRLRASLELDGKSIGNLDMMIAANALAGGFILVTHDKAFARVKGLKLEDWAKP